VEVAPETRNVPAASVGIDFGLSGSATLSDGQVVETQAHLRQSEAKLKRLQRALCRKKKGPKNQKKWKRRVTRFHERVASQCADFLHKLTSSVVAVFGVICVEDLNLKGLCRTRLAICDGLTLADRQWECPGCGTVHDRDLNAAINLAMEGIALLAGSGYVGVTPVELLASTVAVRSAGKPVAMKQELDDAHSYVSER
jgi:putative transposase